MRRTCRAIVDMFWLPSVRQREGSTGSAGLRVDRRMKHLDRRGRFALGLRVGQVTSRKTHIVSDSIGVTSGELQLK